MWWVYFNLMINIYVLLIVLYTDHRDFLILWNHVISYFYVPFMCLLNMVRKKYQIKCLKVVRPRKLNSLVRHTCGLTAEYSVLWEYMYMYICIRKYGYICINSVHTFNFMATWYLGRCLIQSEWTSFRSLVQLTKHFNFNCAV